MLKGYNHCKSGYSFLFNTNYYIRHGEECSMTDLSDTIHERHLLWTIICHRQQLNVLHVNVHLYRKRQLLRYTYSFVLSFDVTN